MSTRSVSKLVSKSADFISIDKSVVESIDELYGLVSDATMVLEAIKALDLTDFQDNGSLNRIALKNLNHVWEVFTSIFNAIGTPGDRMKGGAS